MPSGDSRLEPCGAMSLGPGSTKLVITRIATVQAPVPIAQRSITALSQYSHDKSTSNLAHLERIAPPSGYFFCACLSRVHQSGSGPLFHVQPRESSHTTISTKNASPSANKRLYYSCRVVLTKAIALVSVTMEFMAGHGHGAALVRATTEFMASHGTDAWRPCLTMALVRGGHGPSA